MFENAKWIAKEREQSGQYNSAEEENCSVLCRKVFNINKTVKKAQVHICALGLGVYTLNGNKICDEVLCTPFTAYDKRVIYRTYDIISLLCEGENVIGVHMGNGFYNENTDEWCKSSASWKDRVKMIAVIEIDYEDGTKETINSDKTWKMSFGPCTYNRPRQGEIYDMNLVQDGFDKPGFDDSKWTNAVIARAPGGKLVTSNMPPIRVIRRIQPISLHNGIYDFGENISGWVRIKASGSPGQEMHIKYDEWLKEDGSFFGHIDRFHRSSNLKLCQEEYVIFSGKANEEYAPSFCYHGFRYVKVKNAPEDLEIIAEVVHTDLLVIGSFECSDEMLNKIHKASVQSTLSNYHGIPTDCPHREQNGWTGDALISAHQSLKNFDMKEAYRKWLLDFKDAQRYSGQIPGVIPTSGWYGYHAMNGPAWDSALIQIPLFVYEAYGDKSIIEEMWQNITLYMDYMDYMSDEYLVGYGLGDWCPPPYTDVCSSEITDSAFYYANACACKKMAALIDEDTDKWEILAENIRNAWRGKFLGEESNHKKQTFLACAIYYGLLNENELPVYAKKLSELVISNGYHIDCGIIGAKCIFDALSDNGYADVVYKMITVPTMPSYAYWINRGMTTFAETWQMRNSQNHHMYSEVDNWLYKHVGGFDLKDGIVVINPQIIDGIDYVKLTWRDVEVERRYNHIKIKSERNIMLNLNNKKLSLDSGVYEYEL